MIHLRQKFASIEDVKSAITEYEKEKHVQLWISHSRTIESAKRRGCLKEIKPELQYAELTYSCRHYGKYQSRGKGIRPNTFTIRQDCKARIVLKASEDGQFMEVFSCIEEHNHELNAKIEGPPKKKKKKATAEHIIPLEPDKDKIPLKVTEDEIALKPAEDEIPLKATEHEIALKASNDDIPLKTAKTFEEKPDSCQIFANYIASELRLLKSNYVRNNAKRKIQAVIIHASEEDDTTYVVYDVLK